jgi:hypothetical protein
VTAIAAFRSADQIYLSPKRSTTSTRKAFAILRIKSSVGLATPRSNSLMNP